MLRRLRQTFGVIFFVLITLLFLDFTGSVHLWFGWLAKIQFLPALLALNVGVVLLLIALTLLFGRIYCSVICPMGVFQDVIARIGLLFKGKRERKTPYSYSPARSVLRYSVLGVFIVALVAGIGSVVALLAPYSSYGRIASNLFQPIYRWGNNIIASIAEHYESYAFYETDLWIRSLPTFFIAVVTVLVIGYLAARHGRTYCNTICPVGTVLGFFSRFSFFRIAFDADKCKQCSMCSRNCKASCIDYKTMTVDYSRCVTCGNCLEKCKFDALHYKFGTPSLGTAFPKKAVPVKASGKVQASNGNSTPSDPGLRALIGTLTVGAAAKVLGQTIPEATDKKVDGGLADIIDKEKPVRATPLTPPGSLSARNLRTHCTGCQLCVSACPNGVLRPSTDLLTLMQPEMSYERGYCRPECIECSSVCPAGAILPISKEDKSSIQIGHAVWVRNDCIPVRDGQECGNCARHCPTTAIQMVLLDESNPESKKIPVINTEMCIGCGTCEALCPSRPLSAIYVEGHEVHRVI